ncbi:MAG: penicillin acylase family protein [Kineosporiaceae bacterium]
MARRRLFRLSLLAGAGLMVALLVSALVLSVIVVRRPFPSYSGTMQLVGLDHTVSIIRDDQGVPQIYADSPTDLFRAQGYVHAQDRFFEMDWRRHVTAGKLSELVGEDEQALQADKTVRTLGWRRVAQEEYAALDPTSRSYLQAYAEGVNDYLAGRSSSQLSVNYALLGLAVPLPRIEKWDPVDSLTWFKAMAWDLRGNYGDEMDRARVYGSVRDVARVNQLFPAYPYAGHPPILGDQVQPPATAPETDTSSKEKAKRTTTGTASGTAASGTSASETAASGTAASEQVAQTADATQTADAQALLAALDGSLVQQALDSAERSVAAVPSLLGSGDGLGSNSWVVSGSLTDTGKPLLANDPHLGIGIPGIWYQVGLHCNAVNDSCPFDVAGFGFSGVPGVLIGHNQRISWGFTNLGPDVTDFYLEKVDGANYLRDGKMVPLQSRLETIKVAGSDPVQITVRSTVHGPILSDVLDPVRGVGERAPVERGVPERGVGYAVSLAWTALQPGTDMQAVFAIDSATDFASFRSAALQLDVPAQNIIYADVDGHIGYQAPGRIPVRSTEVPVGVTPVPSDGTWPMPGWDSAFDWTGYVPKDRLPYVQDPAEGFIVAANQAVVGPGYPVSFTRDWDYGFRSQRIRDLITARISAHHKITVADMSTFQADTYNPMAAELVPLMLTTKVDAFTAEGRDLLQGWDFHQPADSAAAAYFNATWAALLDLTFADEMPEGTRPTGGSRWFEVVTTLLKNPQDSWWDDRRTPDVVESRDEVVRRAMVQARLRLTSILGKDAGRWKWGELHQVQFTATPLGGLRLTLPLHPLLNKGPVPVGGGTSIVSAMNWNPANGTFDVTSGPSMRMVVDLGDFNRSRWVNQTGQSGHPGQAHYADQLDAWANNETYPWPFGRDAVEAAADDTLTLEPAAS